MRRIIDHQDGGSGTTAAGLRAGYPTLICPLLGDQPFWADQVYRREVGPGPPSWRRLSAESLAPRLRRLITDDRYQVAAAAISRQLAGKDGPGTATSVLEASQATG